jgi:dienelactone hydrolase
MFLGSDDEEVAPTVCQQVAQRSIESAKPVFVAFYPGATHDFDDPGQRRQSVPGNVAAKADAMTKAGAIIERTKEKGR